MIIINLLYGFLVCKGSHSIRLPFLKSQKQRRPTNNKFIVVDGQIDGGMDRWNFHLSIPPSICEWIDGWVDEMNGMLINELIDV